MNFVGLTRALRVAAMLPALAFCVAALMPAASHAQNVEWRGIVNTYDYSEGCAAAGLSADMRERWDARLVPSGIGANGAGTTLGIFGSGYAVAFRVANGRFNNTLRTVEAGQLGRWVSIWPHQVQIRVSSQTPSNSAWRATTPYVRMVGEVRNYIIEGCNLSFEVSALLRP